MQYFNDDDKIEFTIQFRGENNRFFYDCVMYYKNQGYGAFVKYSLPFKIYVYCIRIFHKNKEVKK